MRKAITLVVLIVGLAGCGLVGVLVDGFKYAKAVESGLEQAIGLKPQVGFNWSNGRLRSVTVTFPRIYDAKPLSELAETVRAVVGKEFNQTPDTILLTFSLDR
jgi:hypothetical protein